MKLELVMLTTVISVITERQVEALFECYEKGDLSGKKVNFGSNPDVTSQLPNGPKACKVPANSTVIFYKKKNHRGDVNFLHTLDEEVFRPSIVVRSILDLGQREGIFVFPEKDFQGGLSTHFDGEKDKVPGNVQVKSVAIIRKSWDWTLVRRCRMSNCARTCLVCLKHPKNKFQASFMKSIEGPYDPYFNIGKLLTILPGICFGQPFYGTPRIPCPQGKILVNGVCTYKCTRTCDSYGVADKLEPCNANGDCVCHSRRKGKTCKSFRGAKISCQFCDNSATNHCKKAKGIEEQHKCSFCIGRQVIGQPTSHSRGCSIGMTGRNGCYRDTYQRNRFTCYCDTDFCSINITKYIDDPNYPTLKPF